VTRPGRRAVAAALALLLAGAGGVHAFAAGRRWESRARPFKDSVEEYVELHRRLRATLPPLDVSSEPRTILTAAGRLASAIREARRGARAGDVFNPVVAATLRARIGYALRDPDRRKKIVHLLTEVEEDEDERPPAGWVPVVNGTLDWFSTGATPHAILEALPDLPHELQYRFVGLDLVLLDVDANLIIDILPAAVSAH
jgi:hypothetical protein